MPPGLYNFYQIYGASLMFALIIIVVLLLGWAIWMHLRMSRLVRQYQGLIAGTSGGNLEEILTEHLTRTQAIEDRLAVAEEHLQRLDQLTARCLQNIGAVRYSAFEGVGSDQSFAVVLADAQGRGVLLNGLHSRNNARVYAKPLQEWESSYSLTDEEKEAIGQARSEGA